jgi:hypothetical protein
VRALRENVRVQEEKKYIKKDKVFSCHVHI